VASLESAKSEKKAKFFFRPELRTIPNPRSRKVRRLVWLRVFVEFSLGKLGLVVLIVAFYSLLLYFNVILAFGCKKFHRLDSS
jgi:hypothetical protein